MGRKKTHTESRHVKILPCVGRVFNYAILPPIKSAVWGNGCGYSCGFSACFPGWMGSAGVCSLTSFFHSGDYSALLRNVRRAKHRNCGMQCGTDIACSQRDFCVSVLQLILSSLTLSEQWLESDLKRIRAKWGSNPCHPEAHRITRKSDTSLAVNRT